MCVLILYCSYGGGGSVSSAPMEEEGVSSAAMEEEESESIAMEEEEE